MELRDAVLRRRMVRNYDGRPVAPEVLDRILDAGRRAPSAGNTQATEYVVLTDDDVARYWDVTLPPDRRATFRWPGLLRAPVLVIPCVRATAYVERYAEDDKARPGLGDSVDGWAVPYWHVDGGMAVMSILLAAVDEGLGALFFGIFDHEDAVRAALAIPEAYNLLGTIALGHPAADEPGRSASRPRRPLDELVHRGGWRPSGPEALFHLALAADWEAAREAGEYRVSTIGLTLEQQGFIHCSFEHQVAATAARFYAGRADVVLLTIDPSRLAHEVRVENTEGGVEQFPHLYGPLPVDAVTAVEPYPT